MDVSGNALQVIPVFPDVSYPAAQPDSFGTSLVGVNETCFPVVALPGIVGGPGLEIVQEAAQDEEDPPDSTLFLIPAKEKNETIDSKALRAACNACKNEGLGVQEASLICGVHEEDVKDVLGDFNAVDDDYKVFVLNEFPEKVEIEFARCLKDLIDSHVYMTNIDVRRLGYEFVREKYRVPSMPKGRTCLLGRRWLKTLMEKHPELDKTDRVERKNMQNPVNFFDSLENYVKTFEIDSSTIFYVEGIDLNIETGAVRDFLLGPKRKVFHGEFEALVCTSPEGMFIPPIFIKLPGSLFVEQSTSTECDVYDVELDEDCIEEELVEEEEEMEEEEEEEVKHKEVEEEEGEEEKEVNEEEEEEKVKQEEEEGEVEKEVNEEEEGEVKQEKEEEEEEEEAKQEKEKEEEGEEEQEVNEEEEEEEEEKVKQEEEEGEVEKEVNEEEEEAKQEEEEGEEEEEEDEKFDIDSESYSEDRNEPCNWYGGSNRDENSDSESDCDSDDIAMKDDKKNDPDYVPLHVTWEKSKVRRTTRGRQNTYLASKTWAKKDKEDSESDYETCAKKIRQESKRSPRTCVKRARRDSETGSKRYAKRNRQNSKTGFESWVPRIGKNFKTGSDACARKTRQNSKTGSKSFTKRTRQDSTTGSKIHAKRAKQDSETDSDTCAKKATKTYSKSPKQDSNTGSYICIKHRRSEDSCLKTKKRKQKPIPLKYKVKVDTGFQEQSAELKEILREDWKGEGDPVSPHFFYWWFEKFLTHVRETISRKILVLLKNPNYLRYYKTIELAREYGVVFLVVPPPTSHKVYPLDGFEMSLERNMTLEVKKCMTKNFDFKKKDFPLVELFKKAYNDTVNVSIVENGFFYSGFWPVNRDIFKPCQGISSSEEDEDCFDPVDAVCNLDPGVQSKPANLKSEKDIQKLCRVCVKETTFTKPLFYPPPCNKPKYYTNNLIELLEARVSLDDGLPTDICNYCVVKVIETTNTRMFASCSHEIQLKLLEAYNKIENGVNEEEDQELQDIIQESEDFNGIHSKEFKKLLKELLTNKTLDMNSICRVCLLSEPCMRFIFSLKTGTKNVDKEEMSQKMMVVSKCEVKIGDGLSSFICFACRCRINYAYEFIQEIMRGYKKLQNIVTKLRDASKTRNGTRNHQQGMQ